MRLRAAEARDVDLLSAIHRQAFPAGWSAEEIADLGSGPGVYGLIVEDKAPLGMILARTVADESEILTLAVIPAARRRGAGLALVEAAAGLAAAQGADWMFLEVARDNLAALALYEGAGFSAAGVRPGYYHLGGGVKIDALVMRRKLNKTAGAP